MNVTSTKKVPALLHWQRPPDGAPLDSVADHGENALHIWQSKGQVLVKRSHMQNEIKIIWVTMTLSSNHEKLSLWNYFLVLFKKITEGIKTYFASKESSWHPWTWETLDFPDFLGSSMSDKAVFLSGENSKTVEAWDSLRTGCPSMEEKRSCFLDSCWLSWFRLCNFVLDCWFKRTGLSVCKKNKKDIYRYI